MHENQTQNQVQFQGPSLQPIPGFPGYWAHTSGQIFSDKSGSLKPLKDRANHAGYKQVPMFNNKKFCCPRVHRLVWMAHVGPIPEGWHIDHLNRVRGDNSLENLEAKTAQANLSTRVFLNCKGRKPGAKDKCKRKSRKQSASASVTTTNTIINTTINPAVQDVDVQS